MVNNFNLFCGGRLVNYEKSSLARGRTRNPPRNSEPVSSEVSVLPNIIAFLSYVLIVTFTPGPNNLISFANATRSGFHRTWRLRLGIFAGFVLVMLASSYFNLVLASFIPRIKPFMGGIGALYMAYLAIHILVSRAGDTAAQAGLDSFLSGLAMQFVNPKVILYCLTVSSSFIVPYYESPLALAGFSVLLASVSLISTSCWALFGSLFYKLFSRYGKVLNALMVLLLLYSAVSILGVASLLR